MSVTLAVSPRHPVEGGDPRNQQQVQLLTALALASRPAQWTLGSTARFRCALVGLAGESCRGREGQTNAESAWLSEIAWIP